MDTTEKDGDSYPQSRWSIRRIAKRTSPKRFSYVSDPNRAVESKDWKDVEEMTDTMEKKKNV